MYWLRKTLKKTFHSTHVFVLRKKFIYPAYSNNLYYFLPVKFQLIIPAAHLIPDLKFQSKTFFTKVISPRETCFLLHFFRILSAINETFLICTWGKNKIINMGCFCYQTRIKLFKFICNSILNGLSFPKCHSFFSCVNSYNEIYHTCLKSIDLDQLLCS